MVVLPYHVMMASTGAPVCLTGSTDRLRAAFMGLWVGGFSGARFFVIASELQRFWLRMLQRRSHLVQVSPTCVTKRADGSRFAWLYLLQRWWVVSGVLVDRVAVQGGRL